MKLVFIESNRPVTDSLTVAETFGKDHDKVLRDIRELECSKEFSLTNFGESTYVNERGREYPKYLITQDGFAFLVMGYTGKEAARFKELYISEFNKMRDGLNKPQFAIPQTLSDALRLAADLSDQKQALELKIEADRSKVVFAESLEVSSNSILIGQLAKLLKQNGIDIGQNRLFEILREEGYLMNRGERRNLPTQRSMDMKIMEIKVGTRSSLSEGTKSTHTTKITGKGQFYFINKFKSLQQAN